MGGSLTRAQGNKPDLGPTSIGKIVWYKARLQIITLILPCNLVSSPDHSLLQARERVWQLARDFLDLVVVFSSNKLVNQNDIINSQV